MASIRLAVVVLFCLTISAPAAAVECWAKTLRNGAHASASGQALAQVEALLRADPRIAAIPDVRLQLHAYAGDVPAHPGAPAAASATAFVHGDRKAWLPDCGLAGWADTVHEASLAVHLNSLGALSGVSPQSFSREGFQAFVEPELSHTPAGLPVYGRRLVAIAPAAIAPLVPVTLGEYLDFRRAEIADSLRDTQASAAEDDEWRAYIAELEQTDPAQAAELRALMAEGEAGADDPLAPKAQLRALEALRARLSAAALAAPVYFSDAMDPASLFPYGQASDPGAVRLVKVNPALWRAGAAKTGIGLIALEVFTNSPATHDDPFANPDPKHAAMLAWLQQADPAPYRALMAH